MFCIIVSGFSEISNLTFNISSFVIFPPSQVMSYLLYNLHLEGSLLH